MSTRDQLIEAFKRVTRDRNPTFTPNVSWYFDDPTAMWSGLTSVAGAQQPPVLLGHVADYVATTQSWIRIALRDAEKAVRAANDLPDKAQAVPIFDDKVWTAWTTGGVGGQGGGLVQHEQYNVWITSSAAPLGASWSGFPGNCPDYGWCQDTVKQMALILYGNTAPNTKGRMGPMRDALIQTITSVASNMDGELVQRTQAHGGRVLPIHRVESRPVQQQAESGGSGVVVAVVAVAAIGGLIWWMRR